MIHDRAAKVAVISVDATVAVAPVLSAEHATAGTVVSAGGEYMMQLKGNASTVHAAAQAVLGAPLFSIDDCDHGRAEQRALTLATVTPHQLAFRTPPPASRSPAR